MKKIEKIIRLIIRSIRQKYWKCRLHSCGDNFVCCSGVIIRSARKVSIGNNVRIGEKSYLNGRGKLTIGNNVLTGPNIFIWTSNHNYYCPELLPYDTKPDDRAVTIKDNVWIGAQSKIVPGITIGEGAVIAMGAVVTKDVPDCAVVGGNPAKIIKYRDIEQYKKLKQENKIIDARN